MLISLVVAASTNNAIGKNNQLLWHLPNDMKYFKNVTWGMPVVMGRLTFLALNSDPLNGRVNIVITKRKDFSAKGVVVVHKIDDAIFFADQHDYNELMVIGGGEIFKETMNIVDVIYLTRIHKDFDGDIKYPKIDPKMFELVEQRDRTEPVPFTFLTYWRRK